MILKNSNQEIESKAKGVYRLIKDNPNLVFNIEKICQIYNSKYNNTMEPFKATTVLSRLFKKDMLLRTKPQDNRWRIQFVLSKTKEYVPNLLLFLNQVRTMLNYFGISTSSIQLRKQKRRAFCGRFYIKGRENLIKFYNEIGFLYASGKQKVLESLVLNRKS
jgi:hypothetical protein